MKLDRPPRYLMAVAMSVTGVVIAVPGTGSAKAQGLYQLVLLRVLEAQVTVGLEGSGDPPGEKGSRTGIALAVPPAGPLLLGVTVNGVPVWATKVKLVDQPPTARSANLE